MADPRKQRSAKGSWRRLMVLVIIGCVAVGGVCWAQQGWWSRGKKRTKPPAPVASIPPATQPQRSDYSRRVVAYIYDGEPVTREELGEFLIARRGADKIELLVNHRLVADACQERGLEVTGAEVEGALADNLHELRLSKKSFASTVQTRYKKSLYEWKEDVIRMRLRLTKLSRHKVHITNAEVEKLYESRYGEKVQGRLILYTADQKRQAQAEYARLRDSEEAFHHKAKHQSNSLLASTAGKVKPFGRHTMGDAQFDSKVFKLRPGEVSELIETPEGQLVIFKCDERIPAQDVSLASVQTQLGAEIRERKVSQTLEKLFQQLQKHAQPRIFLKKGENGGVKYEGPDPTPRPQQVIAVYRGDQIVTREELGEFLIARYGTLKVNELVNQRIIKRACQERGVTVTEQDIQAELQKDLKALNLDRPSFLKRLLARYNKNLYEWKYDEIRPRLMLRKLCYNRVRVTEEDLRKAFQAHYGEKVEGRMILWPPDQTKFALAQYARIRDSEEAFAQAAKQQPSPTLSAKGGRLPPFGRYSLGNDTLEQEALSLQPGEVTTLIGTPQGHVVFRCDKRYPAVQDVTLDQVRPKLEEEVLKKKVRLEMNVIFKQLRDHAKPQVMLERGDEAIDLKAETERALAETAEFSKPLPSRR